MKRGRIRDINDSLLMEIIADMAVGSSLTQACKSRGYNTTTIWGRIQKSSKLYECYLRARDQRSDVLFERMEDLEQEVMDGKIHPKAYRAVAETMKWRLGRMKPRVYGDKHMVEHSGQVNIASEIATARRASIIESVDVQAIDIINNEE